MDIVVTISTTIMAKPVEIVMADSIRITTIDVTGDVIVAVY